MPDKKSPPFAEGKSPPLNGKRILVAVENFALVVLGVMFDESRGVSSDRG